MIGERSGLGLEMLNPNGEAAVAGVVAGTGASSSAAKRASAAAISSSSSAAAPASRFSRPRLTAAISSLSSHLSGSACMFFFHRCVSRALLTSTSAVPAFCPAASRDEFSLDEWCSTKRCYIRHVCALQRQKMPQIDFFGLLSW